MRVTKERINRGLAFVGMKRRGSQLCNDKLAVVVPRPYVYRGLQA